VVLCSDVGCEASSLIVALRDLNWNVLKACEVTRTLRRTKSGRNVANDVAVRPRAHSMMLQMARSVKLAR